MGLSPMNGLWPLITAQGFYAVWVPSVFLLRIVICAMVWDGLA